MKKLLTLILLSAASSAFAASPYVGASAGYLIDLEEHFFSARLGSDVAQAQGLIHSIEAEIGIATEKEFGATADFIPVMGNYRIASDLSQNPFGFFAGAGLGTARIMVSGYGLEDSAWTFAVQVFAGVEYKVTTAFSLTLGARYIWIDEVKLLGTSVDVGDDVALEAGIRFRF